MPCSEGSKAGLEANKKYGRFFHSFKPSSYITPHATAQRPSNKPIICLKYRETDGNVKDVLFYLKVENSGRVEKTVFHDPRYLVMWMVEKAAIFFFWLTLRAGY